MEKQRPIVGVIISEADYSFYSSSMENIQKELFSADIDVAVFSTVLTRGEQEHVDAENNIFNLINYDVLDGMIVFLNTLNCTSIKEKLLGELKERFSGKPVIIIEDNSTDFESVIFDNASCADILITHLAQVHNVKRIAYVSGPEQSAFHNRVLAGFRTALDKHGISLADSDIHYGKDWMDDYSPIAEKLVENGLPDAIVCCSDFTAAEILGELGKLGVKVPKDTIVTGYSKNEPFVADYMNITTVERSTRSMSLNAAHSMIRQIRGTEFPLDATPVGELCCGITCGCGEPDYGALSRSAVDSMVHSRRNGFDSYYNFMSEELIGSPDFEDYLWKLNWYTHFLGDYKGFWMCLNENVMHSENTVNGFTERITIPYQNRRGSASVNFERGFNREEMLPYIFKKREKPSAFIFSSLHLSDTIFGYTVLCYGDSGKVYDESYAKWLRYVTCALEKQRRHILYEDAVINGQIRDSLTGLMNMRGFKSVMTERFKRNPENAGYLRIISLDVADLSGINTAYGYSEGDKLLQKLCVIMNNSASEDDICVRVSGDEFIIAGILSSEDAFDDVPTVLQRNLDSFNSSPENDYGIHVYSARVITAFDSLEVLDKLPYEASYQRTLTKGNHNKAIIRNRSHAEEEFDPEERSYVVKLLNDNLFTYNFQPIVNAQTGEIFAYEGLMRSGTERRLSPVAILAHAEALGRLGDVERLTLVNLFTYLSEHREQFEGKYLFVNSIPSYTLPDKDFEELFARFQDIMPNITIEFTEQTEASSEQLEEILSRSKRMGFNIAIDDYGTGYSNISNLLTFMPNFVKIDRSLISNIHEDKRKQHFTRNIIEYGHDNNFKVLAEGVELYEELKTVIEMGVDLIQGYYTAKPSPEVVSEIDTYVASEIISINHAKLENIVRKTFFTGTEKETTLMALEFDGFTDVCVNSPEYTINSSENYNSEMKIRIKDGLDCHLTLNNVVLKSGVTYDCIVLGENSKLTLEIKGYVTLMGAIRVPESATLNIVGSGMLTFQVGGPHCYCIGTDGKHGYGNIGMYLKGSTFMKIDGDDGIAIGGGCNTTKSKIDIECLDLSIDMTGKELLGIGCIYDPSSISVRNTKLTIRQQCARGVAVGNSNQPADISIENSLCKLEGYGDHTFGIFLPNSSGSRLEVSDTEFKMEYKSKELIAIGSQNSDADIVLRNCTIDALCEGANAHCIGNTTGSGSLLLENCTGKIRVSTGRGGAYPDTLSRVTIRNSDIICE